MRRVVPLVIGIAVTGLVLSPLAMAKVSKENVRAVNAARMRAEAVNGGLSNYRAAKCMYATGQGGGDCLRSDSDGLVFVFGGSAPGWQEAGESPTVETEIQVSADGASIVDLTYNGAPR